MKLPPEALQCKPFAIKTKPKRLSLEPTTDEKEKEKHDQSGSNASATPMEISDAQALPSNVKKEAGTS